MAATIARFSTWENQHCFEMEPFHKLVLMFLQVLYSSQIILRNTDQGSDGGGGDNKDSDHTSDDSTTWDDDGGNNNPNRENLQVLIQQMVVV